MSEAASKSIRTAFRSQRLNGATKPEATALETQWSASRFNKHPEEKEAMARYFAEHEFLVPSSAMESQNSSLDPVSRHHSGSFGGSLAVKRDTVASIIANQGTSPNQVVKSALTWIEEHQDLGPFFLIWYSPGHLVPETLRQFRKVNPHMLSAARLFLLPGEIDLETESVFGPDAEKFARGLKRRFTYALLSAYAFDIYTGNVYFYRKDEVALQRAVATRHAVAKCLFVDFSKFRNEGEYGYGIHDLLENADTVAIYTVSSGDANDDWILEGFLELGKKVLDLDAKPVNRTERKQLCLRIVNRYGHLVNEGATMLEGTLRTRRQRRTER
jgi:hypothetical protein